ncbi:uncharacterized protein LOC123969949 [Micropterus dolomieu]|uniref:uncharacterized protein LOC123969949 n=1 Tax=Micropterus dolomieu TaxID=147949 RepID=UPI001E8E2522|nr:uncharacterized protein LOC123969949 [Micropterus dolomieu]
MTGFIRVAVAVLSLLSVGQSAPVSSCESLIQPLEIQGREQLLGKWMHVAESTEDHNVGVVLKTFRESHSLKITAATESDAVALMGTVKAFGYCVTNTVKMTLGNSTLQPRTINISPTVNLLKTGCSDCLLLQFYYQMTGRNLKVLQLLSKRQTVTAAELEEFKKQAECLNFAQPFSLDQDEGVCPEPQETEIIDVPRYFVNGQMSNLTNATEEITKSVGGAENFLKMVSDVLSKN